MIGLGAVVYLAIASKPSLRIASAEALSGAALYATFLNVLLYQGIGGSFEDTRHIWLLLGLLIGSARIFRVPGHGTGFALETAKATATPGR